LRIGISCYIGPKKTGIGHYLEGLLNSIPKAEKDKNKYFAFVNEQVFPTLPNDNNVKKLIYRVSPKSPILTLLWHQIILPLRLLINHIDILFIPNVTLLLFKIRPTVLVIHDLIEFNVPERFDKLRMFYRHHTLPTTANKADKIITDSENSKKDIVKFLGVSPDRIEVVYPGINPQYRLLDKMSCRQRVVDKYGVTEDFILSVGTLDHPGKNHVTLIKAYSQLIQNYQIAEKLMLVGKKGVRHEEIFQLIQKLGLNHKVIYVGYVPDEDVPLFYNAASLVVFPSLYEGFGFPCLEAMACGCPVIASNTSSIPEIVGDAGILVNPTDVIEMSNAIYSLLTSSDLRKDFSDRGICRVRNFTWVEAARKILQIFEQVYTSKKVDRK
jgi:glycosyltransferase involved in cell wall biosynthesis